MQISLQDRERINGFLWIKEEGLGEQQKGFTKKYKDTCSDAYVYYFDFGDCFMGIYICQITKLYT